MPFCRVVGASRPMSWPIDPKTVTLLKSVLDKAVSQPACAFTVYPDLPAGWLANFASRGEAFQIQPTPDGGTYVQDRRISAPE